MKKQKLCSQHCCPTIEIINNQFVIKDDFGGQVILTLEQLKVLAKTFVQLMGKITC